MSLNWYAIKVYFNRTAAVCDQLCRQGIELYRQDVIPSYVFLHCTKEQMAALRQALWEQAFVYCTPDRKEAAPISEKEMSAFMLVTSMGANGLEYLGDDKAEYHTGDLVRVTAGPFEGAVGHIKRIKRDRKLIVSINGVAAVAVAHIPSQLLEKVQR